MLSSLSVENPKKNALNFLIFFFFFLHKLCVSVCIFTKYLYIYILNIYSLYIYVDNIYIYIYIYIYWHNHLIGRASALEVVGLNPAVPYQRFINGTSCCFAWCSALKKNGARMGQPGVCVLKTDEISCHESWT